MLVPTPTLPLPNDHEKKIDELSVSYERFTFDDTVRSVTYYNGYTQLLSTTGWIINATVSGQTKSIDGGHAFVAYLATDDERKNRQVWALTKINGTWKSEDWTETGISAFCRDKSDERIEELILIYSNGNFSTTREDGFDANAAGKIGSQVSKLVASQMPCWKLKGQTNATLKYSDSLDSFTLGVSGKPAASLPTRQRYGTGLIAAAGRRRASSSCAV